MTEYVTYKEISELKDTIKNDRHELANSLQNNWLSPMMNKLDSIYGVTIKNEQKILSVEKDMENHKTWFRWIIGGLIVGGLLWGAAIYNLTVKQSEYNYINIMQQIKVIDENIKEMKIENKKIKESLGKYDFEITN